MGRAHPGPVLVPHQPRPHPPRRRRPCECDRHARRRHAASASATTWCSDLLRASGARGAGRQGRRSDAAAELAAATASCRPSPRRAPRCARSSSRPRGRVPGGWLDRLRRAAARRATAPVAAPAPAATNRSPSGNATCCASSQPAHHPRDRRRAFVSTNTLKFHLKVIYRKLGVSSRAEAADVARRMTGIRTVPPAS